MREAPVLHDFIRSNREELIERGRLKVALRSAPRPTADALLPGVAQFLTQLEVILRRDANGSSPDGGELTLNAIDHGAELMQRGLSVGQVVHGYADVCQAVMDLAADRSISIAAAEFRSLNRCLDEAIAVAVTEYTSRREAAISRAEVERLEFLAHELRNLLGVASLAFQLLKKGDIGINGSTGAVLERSLRSLRCLVDQSLCEVRLAAGIIHRERIRLPTFIGEIEIGAALDARKRRLELTVECADCDVEILADRHLLASAISKLLQNAFKFTRSHSHVWLRADARDQRVRIEIEDQCGGLPSESRQHLGGPFGQDGAGRATADRGLAISTQAVRANGGRITVRDRPGEGCVFAVELPVARGCEFVTASQRGRG